MSDDKNSGSCLCGGVSFKTNGPLREVINCHCIQCRKQTGHFLAATNCGTENFTMTRDDTLTWYRASDTAQRGFCGTCGSTLFWQSDTKKDYISIAAGAFDGNTKLKTKGNIFVTWKGDYYDIPDDQPQFPQSD